MSRNEIALYLDGKERALFQAWDGRQTFWILILMMPKLPGLGQNVKSIATWVSSSIKNGIIIEPTLKESYEDLTCTCGNAFSIVPDTENDSININYAKDDDKHVQ